MHPSTTSAEELDRAEPGIRSRARLWPAASAIALGFAILYLVGFADSATIDDAAHDSRHSLNFPCH
jgi:cobalt transporter subunit CbtB